MRLTVSEFVQHAYRYHESFDPALLIDVKDLGPEAQSQLGSRIVKALNKRDEDGRDWTDEFVYLMVLDTFGIRCPHPVHRQKPYGYGGGVVCEICDMMWVKIK